MQEHNREVSELIGYSEGMHVKVDSDGMGFPAFNSQPHNGDPWTGASPTHMKRKFFWGPAGSSWDPYPLEGSKSKQ